MELREAYETDGVVRVPGVLPRGEVAAMRDLVLARVAGIPFVELTGARRPALGTDEQLWEIGRAPVFAPLAAALPRTVDEVFGAGTWAPVAGQHGGLAAPNLPLHDAPWSVPHGAWHVDEPTAAAHPRGWSLLAFAFLDDVEPGGGATVAIAGSHRRLRALATHGMLTTDEALPALAAEPWFAALFAPSGDRRHFLVDPYESMGIPLRVVELTAAAGDLVLMDPRCLHTISANASHRPRLTMRLTCGRP